MTTRIINYFKTYAKYDKQQQKYYIDNLKTVFEHYYKYNDDNESIEHYYEDDELENRITTSICEFKRFEDGFYSYIDLKQKQIIEIYEYAECDTTVDYIIDIFNFLMLNSFNCNGYYKSRFQKYILYILERQRTEQTHEENKYKEYKKFKQWLDLYDMSYKISSQIHSQRLKNIEDKINNMIDYKIKSNLYDIFNENPNVWKDLINNLNEQSKEILIDEIVKFNENDVIKRVSDKISKNNVCHKIAEKVVKDSYKQVNEQLQDYLKTPSMNEMVEKSVEKSVEDYFNYRNYLSVRCGDYINKHVINLNDRLNNITKSIKELKLKYVNNENVENKNINNENVNNENVEDKNDYSKCFIPHGRKLNLKLNELMKFTKYNDVKVFKAELINNNIIKKDFVVNGSTYRLTEEQKNQFIKDFNKFK